jgi:8-oxo-dGTP pyrophosphatase MutT (NUDIX family)
MTEDCFHLGIKALIRNKKGELLLLLKNTQDPYWDLPGGRIQKNETLVGALKREVFEETGLQNLLQILPFAMALTHSRIFLPTGDVGLIFKIYLCDVVDDNSISLSDEHTRHEWFDPIQAAELLSKNFPTELIEKLSTIRVCPPS